MKYFVEVAYPSPSSYGAGLAAIVYLVSLALAAATGIPFVLIRAFPVLRKALTFDRNYAKLAILLGVAIPIHVLDFGEPDRNHRV